MRNEKFKLPYCTYIWQGKAGKDLNGDGDIKNVAANPTAIPPTPEYKEEGWCFAYGEKEWMDPEVHPLTKVKLNWQGYKDLATVISTRRISCE